VQPAPEEDNALMGRATRNWIGAVVVIVGVALCAFCCVCYKPNQAQRIGAQARQAALAGKHTNIMVLCSQIETFSEAKHGGEICRSVRAVCARWRRPDNPPVRLSNRLFVRSICLGALEPEPQATAQIVSLRCTHVFHRPCLHKWFDKSSNCPLCQHNYGTRYGMLPGDGTAAAGDGDTATPREPPTPEPALDDAPRAPPAAFSLAAVVPVSTLGAPLPTEIAE
jgi:hypothetical protein